MALGGDWSLESARFRVVLTRDASLSESALFCAALGGDWSLESALFRALGGDSSDESARFDLRGGEASEESCRFRDEPFSFLASIGFRTGDVSDNGFQKNQRSTVRLDHGSSVTVCD